MDNIYTDAKGNKFTRKSAFYTSKELNLTAQGGLWTWEIDRESNLYLAPCREPNAIWCQDRRATWRQAGIG